MLSQLNIKLEEECDDLAPLAGSVNVSLSQLALLNKNLILVNLLGQGSKTDVILCAATRRGESRGEPNACP